jgi:hypothetical protein
MRRSQPRAGGWREQKAGKQGNVVISVLPAAAEQELSSTALIVLSLFHNVFCQSPHQRPEWLYPHDAERSLLLQAAHPTLGT